MGVHFRLQVIRGFKENELVYKKLPETESFRWKLVNKVV